MTEIDTKILVELAEIKTSTKKTEEHLMTLNGKVAINQEKINDQRNDLTQLFSSFSSILERVQDAKIERKEEDEAIGGLRNDVDDVKFWKKYVIVGIGLLWGGLIIGAPLMVNVVKGQINTTVTNILATHKITAE